MTDAVPTVPPVSVNVAMPDSASSVLGPVSTPRGAHEMFTADVEFVTVLPYVSWITAVRTVWLPAERLDTEALRPSFVAGPKVTFVETESLRLPL